MQDCIYIRFYTFGVKQPYDAKKLVKLAETVVVSFEGPEGEVEKTLTLPKSEDVMFNIVRLGEKLMRKEYPEYKADDIVEGVEIVQKDRKTYIHFYRPFSLSSKFVIGK